MGQNSKKMVNRSETLVRLSVTDPILFLENQDIFLEPQVDRQIYSMTLGELVEKYGDHAVITIENKNPDDTLFFNASINIEWKSEETDEEFAGREWFERATTEIKSINEEIDAIYKELDELRKSWRDQQNQMNKFVDPGTFLVGEPQEKLIDKEMKTLVNPFYDSVIFGDEGDSTNN
jgi:hypothetical protein